MPRPPLTRRKTRKTTIAVAAVVVAVAAVAAGIPVYLERVKPFRTTVLTVDGVSVDMRYFLKRLALAGQQPLTVLIALSREMILRKTAGNPPYRIVVSAADVDEYARSLARGGAEAIGEAEFREWYRQMLSRSRLSDAELRDFLETGLLAQKMTAYLSSRIPTAGEQVFVNMIRVADIDAGLEVKKRYDAGSSFADLARTYCQDEELKREGGKLGWFPRGTLNPIFENVAFSLAARECSEPFSVDDRTVFVLMVSAREAVREFDEQAIGLLKSRALDQWFKEESVNHTIAFHGFHDGYDSETDDWVRKQIKGLSSQASTADGSIAR